MINNIFLDLGTNLGQGLKKFHEKFNLLNHPEWLIYCFEPNNEINIETLFPNTNNIIYENKAIWIEDKWLEFRKQGHNKDNLNGLGSKLECVEKITNPSNCHYKIDLVQGIDFSKILKELKKKYPNTDIYVKMDIEGAEFEVINHLIQEKTINYIKELYCECHGRFKFNSSDHDSPNIKIKINEIENKLKENVEKNGVKFYFWD